MATKIQPHKQCTQTFTAPVIHKTVLNGKIKIEPPLLVQSKAPSALKKKEKATEAKEDVKNQKRCVKQCM